MPVVCPFRLLAYKSKTNPVITWDFNNIGYTQTDFRFQIASDSVYSNIIYDTGKIAGSETSYTIPTTLKYLTNYYTRGKVWADSPDIGKYGIECERVGLTPYTNSSYIDCGTNSNFDFNTAFTVIGWIKLKENIGDVSPILSKFFNTGYAIRVFSNQLFFSLNGSGDVMASVITLPVDEWVQIVIRWDGSAYRMYINSVLDRTYVSAVAPNSTGQNFYFGKWTPNPETFYDATQIDFDEFWVYNTDAGEAEITNHYNSGLGTALPLSTIGLVAQYHFEEIDGTILNDSFASNNGTLINTPELMIPHAIEDGITNYESNWSTVLPIDVDTGDMPVTSLLYDTYSDNCNVDFDVHSHAGYISYIYVYAYHKTNGWQVADSMAGGSYLTLSFNKDIDFTDYKDGFIIVMTNVGYSTTYYIYGTEYLGSSATPPDPFTPIPEMFPFYMINPPENINIAAYQEYDLTPYIDNQITKESEITKGSQLLNFNIDQTRYDWFSILNPKTFIELWKGRSALNPYFSGWIQNRTPSLNGVIKNIAVRCVDPSDDMQGIIINYAYVNKTAYEIINHILNIYEGGRIARDYGFVLGNIETGKEIIHTFKNEYFFDIMKYLGDLNNCVWQVRVEGRFPNIIKYIDFVSIDYAYSDYTYTTAISNFNIKQGSLNYDDGLITFANAILLIGGKTESSLVTQYFYPVTSSEYTFYLQHPPLFYNINAFIKVNTTSITTIGIDGIDDFTTCDALYNTDERFVKINPAFSPSPGGNTVSIGYTWLYPLTCYMEDITSIDTYGKKERKETREDIIDSNVAKDFCKLYLQKNAIPAVRIGFDVEMDITTAKIGEQSKIEISEYSINDYYPLVRKSEIFSLPWFLDTQLQFQNINLSLELKIKEIEDRIKRLEREKDTDTTLDQWLFQKENIAVSDLCTQEILGGEDVYWKIGDKIGFGIIR